MRARWMRLTIVVGLLLAIVGQSALTPDTYAAATLRFLYGSGSQTGGKDITLRIALTEAAPAGGAVVSLSSSDGAINVPATTTVSSGQTDKTIVDRPRRNRHERYGLGHLPRCHQEPHGSDQGTGALQPGSPNGDSSRRGRQGHCPDQRTSSRRRFCRQHQHRSIRSPRPRSGYHHPGWRDPDQPGGSSQSLCGVERHRAAPGSASGRNHQQGLGFLHEEHHHPGFR
jgi:hypothetical protein